MLTLAIAKGYLWDEAQGLFNQMGVTFKDNLEKSRQLYTIDTSKKYKKV